jgi:hypothetical protein
MPAVFPKPPVRHHAHRGNATTMPTLRKFVPWLILFEMLKAGRSHWDRLDPDDRAEVTDMMRRSHGNPRRLTAADRAQLTALARRMHLVRLGASMATAAVIGHRRQRRRRGGAA